MSIYEKWSSAQFISFVDFSGVLFGLKLAWCPIYTVHAAQGLITQVFLYHIQSLLDELLPQLPHYCE